MKNLNSLFLICSLYNLIVQTVPLGSSPLLSISGLQINTDPPDAVTFTNGQAVLERQQEDQSPEPVGPAIIITTRTITSIVMHIVPWSPSQSSIPFPAPWLTTTTTPVATTPLAYNHSRPSWSLEHQPLSTITKTTILYVAGSIMCVSLAFLLVHMLCTLSQQRAIRRYCCFGTTLPKENGLRGVELEESAGVSWTEGSNLTTPYPEAPVPGEWSGSWADMVVVGSAGVFGSTGRAGDLVRAGSLRRNKKKVEGIKGVNGEVG